MHYIGFDFHINILDKTCEKMKYLYFPSPNLLFLITRISHRDLVQKGSYFRWFLNILQNLYLGHFLVVFIVLLQIEIVLGLFIISHEFQKEYFERLGLIERIFSQVEPTLQHRLGCLLQFHESYKSYKRL